MAKFYGTKILKKDISIENVPTRWRTETENWLLINQQERRENERY